MHRSLALLALPRSRWPSLSLAEAKTANAQGRTLPGQRGDVARSRLETVQLPIPGLADLAIDGLQSTSATVLVELESQSMQSKRQAHSE